jgi:hypothetical protein
MTKNDCVEHNLEYYDSKFNNIGKDAVASKSSEQPLFDYCKEAPQAVVRDCGSTYSNELFGPMWDNIDSNDGVTESRERLCEPVNGTGLDNFTSKLVFNFFICVDFHHDLALSSCWKKVTMIWSIRALHMINRNWLVRVLSP